MVEPFWCFFWKLATLKACVNSASLWCPAVPRLSKHPPTKSTIFPQHHQPRSSSQHSAPGSFPLCAPALNVSRITESPSHMKSQTSSVTSHIYLENDCDRVLLALANQACFLSMRRVKNHQILTFNFRSSVIWYQIFNTSKVTYCKMI